MYYLWCEGRSIMFTLLYCVRCSKYAFILWDIIPSNHVICQAINTVLGFVSSRKHLATTFSVVRLSVEALLKQCVVSPVPLHWFIWYKVRSTLKLLPSWSDYCFTFRDVGFWHSIQSIAAWYDQVLLHSQEWVIHTWKFSFQFSWSICGLRTFFRLL